MNNEEKLLDKIRKSAEDVQVPENLSPETMRQKLESETGGQKPSHQKPEAETDEQKPSHRIPRIYKYGTAAAAVLVLALAVWRIPELLKTGNSSSTQNSTTQESVSETDAEAQLSAANEGTGEGQTTAAGTNGSGTAAGDTNTADTNAAGTNAAGQTGSASAQADAKTGLTRLDGVLAPAATYTDVYDKIKDAQGLIMYDKAVMEESQTADTGGENTAADAAGGSVSANASQSSKSMASGTTSDSFSSTNTQVNGVDEGDLVKTDGTYIYVLHSDGSFSIVRAEGGTMTLLSKTALPNKNESVEEMYIKGDKLILVAQGLDSSMYRSDADAGTTDGKSRDAVSEQTGDADADRTDTEIYMEDENADQKKAITDSSSTADYYYVRNAAYTCIYTYDLADRSAPRMAGRCQQDGSFETSRMTGDLVYLLSSYDADPKSVDDTVSYVPEVQQTPLEADSIYLPEQTGSSSYLVISSMNPDAPETIVDKKAVLSAGSDYYVSTTAIYINGTDWVNDSRNTTIVKLKLEDGSIIPWAVGQADGYLNDMFSLDEYNGYLRAVTTADDSNTVSIFDDTMKLTGKVNGLAPGEIVYSARFLGDTGYFVTYKNMDPLFSVDLSDPENPKILGELKITGFSEYLHFYGRDRLLGIGWETDPDTGDVKGLKLSMFSLADPANVTELHKTVIRDVQNTTALTNYKSILVNDEKNILGFTVWNWADTTLGNTEGNYLLFSYEDENGFDSKASIPIESKDGYADDYENARGVYIGDTFYLVGTTSIKAYNMADAYKELKTLALS